MPLALESCLGPYEIVSLIGSGAMGEVYRARDKRLGRDVALKIVSSRDADEETRRRFEAEARAVSALNHPNVLTVHDVGREDGISFLVTELIEGQSLRQILRGGELPMRKVLDYGIQIADGLAAAHDEGIIHRDLKPENIMITRDDRVKILDFGIAKTAESGFSDSERTLSTTDTAPGLLIGTTAYMSPEQARGTRVTYFTDQFSAGLVLFEMATGYPAFRRETGLATLSAILTEDPPELTVGSMAFRWLVKRLLHKEPDHRYGSMHDVLRDLRHARAALGDTTEPQLEAPVPQIPRAARRWNRPLAATLVVAAALGAGFATGWLVRPLAGFAAHDFRPVATGSEPEVFPAWAPDGRTLAWSGEVSGTFQIFTRTLGSWLPTQVTREPGDCLFPFWSPDGGRIFYSGRAGLYVVGATGGAPQLVLRGVVQAAVAPDGVTFAVLRRTFDSGSLELFVGPLTSLRRVPVSGLPHQKILPWSYLRFAPDGKRLAAWLSLSGGTSELWTFSVDGGDARRQLEQLASSPVAREFSWFQDSRRIVFADRTGLEGGSHLWLADLRTGIQEPLTSGTGREASPAASPNGRTVAFTSAVMNYDVVRIGHDGTTDRVLATNRFEMSPSSGSDGQLVWVTDQNGRPEIWLRTNQENPRPMITPEVFHDGRTVSLSDTALSPDGTRLAFRRVTPGGEAIWISTLNGDAPVRLGNEPEQAFQRSPGWSPDGNEIVYSSARKGRSVLVRARVGGVRGPAVIAEDAGISPRWSPKGDLIAAIGPEEGLTLLAPDGTARRTIGSGTWLLHGWSADGAAIVGIRRSARMELARADVATGAESVMATIPVNAATLTLGTAIGLEPMNGFTPARDGSGFITSILDVNADIWTLER
jgi:Tol biopolymer transport system component